MVEFTKSHAVISDAEKANVIAFAKEKSTTEAHKIHLKGFAGEEGMTYDERKELVLARAFAVKTMILEENRAIQAQKTRVFFKASDRAKAPSVQMNAFATSQDAEKDAMSFLRSRKSE